MHVRSLVKCQFGRGFVFIFVFLFKFCILKVRFELRYFSLRLFPSAARKVEHVSISNPRKIQFKLIVEWLL